MSDKNFLHEPLVLKGLTVIAAQIPAFAGAVMSLAFVGKLNAQGRFVAVMVGLITAVFIAPALTDVLLHLWAQMPASIGSAVRFLVGLSAMGALPKLLKWIESVAGNPTGLLAKIATPDTPAVTADDQANGKSGD